MLPATLALSPNAASAGIWGERACKLDAPVSQSGPMHAAEQPFYHRAPLVFVVLRLRYMVLYASCLSVVRMLYLS